MEKKWSLYILHCADGTLYTGIALEPDKRLAAHNAGKGAKYTRGRRPVEMVYCEGNLTHSDALRREFEVKALSRKQKWELIRNSANITVQT